MLQYKLAKVDQHVGDIAWLQVLLEELMMRLLEL